MTRNHSSRPSFRTGDSVHTGNTAHSDSSLPRTGPTRRQLVGGAAALGAGALGSTLSGCGTAAADDTVELDYWLWDANQLPAYAEAIDKFMAQNPGITVRITQMGWDDYWTKLTASFVAEAAPDVFTDHLGRYPEFVKLSVLNPLDGFDEITALGENHFKPGLQELWTGQDGKKYGTPKDYDAVAIMYDRNAITDAGLTDDDLAALDWNPTDGGSFEQLIAHLSVDVNGVRGDEDGFDAGHVATYGLAADTGIDYVGQTSWSSFAFANGWTFTDTDTWGTHFNYDQPEFQDTIAWWFGLVDKGFFAPFGMFGDSSPKQFQVQSKKAGIALEGSWMITTYRNLEGIDLGIAPQPAGPIGHPMSIFNGLGDSMSVQSRHKAEAAKLIAFLGSDASQEIIGSNTVVFPASNAGTDAAIEAYKRLDLDVTPYTDRVDNGETGLYPLVENAAEIASIMQTAFDKIWLRQIEASDFTAYNERINALFD